MTAAPAGDLITDWLTLDTADGPTPLYRVRPRSEDLATPPTAVIDLQEAFGVNEHIQDVARRVAGHAFHCDSRSAQYVDDAARKGMAGQHRVHRSPSAKGRS